MTTQKERAKRELLEIIKEIDDDQAAVEEVRVYKHVEESKWGPVRTPNVDRTQYVITIIR